MEQIIVDTSVVVKWFSKEKDSDKALFMLKKHKDGELIIIIPNVVILELINALYFGAKFLQEEIQEAIEAIYDFGIIILPIDRTLLINTAKIMTSNKITSYDALYLSLAEEMNISLITADKKHHRKRMSKLIRYL